MSDHLHHVTGLPYFGHAEEWKDLVQSELVPSQRATRSSRTPGKLNEGTIWSAKRQISACTNCGTLRVEFPGVHAPRHDRADPLVVIDCVGRRCAKDADGYYQTESP